MYANGNNTSGITTGQVGQRLDKIANTSPKETVRSFYGELMHLMTAMADYDKPVTLYGKTFTTQEEKSGMAFTAAVSLWMQDYSNIVETTMSFTTNLMQMEKTIDGERAKGV